MIGEVEVEALNKLAYQLSRSGKPRESVHGKLDILLSNTNFHLMAAVDEDKNHQIVGLATIFFQDRLFSPMMAHIDDVVLDSSYRGKRIGEQLVKALLDAAQKNSDWLGEPITIELTSRPTPERQAARKIYQKLGFEIISQAASETGTDLFRKHVKPLPGQ